MNELTISEYAKRFEFMSLESKIALLSLLTERIKQDMSKKKENSKASLAKELFGVWANVEDDMEQVIYSSRTSSDRIIDLD